MSDAIPETTIFYEPVTGRYGFSTRFRGQHPHHTIATFDSVDEVLRWCDPHRERIWEEASDADETASRARLQRGNRGLAHGTLDACGVVRALAFIRSASGLPVRSI